MTTWTLAHVLGLCALGAAGDGWTIDRPCEGVVVLRDDTGAWGGFSMGVAHQHRPEYQVRKTLDELPGLELQPKKEQTPFKISYYIDPEKAPSIEEIMASLRQKDLTANVLSSFGQFLDITHVP